MESSRKNSVKSLFESSGVGGGVFTEEGGGGLRGEARVEAVGRGDEEGVASSLGALSVNFLLRTNQECRGEAGLGSRGKEQERRLTAATSVGGGERTESQRSVSNVGLRPATRAPLRALRWTDKNY